MATNPVASPPRCAGMESSTSDSSTGTINPPLVLKINSVKNIQMPIPPREAIQARLDVIANRREWRRAWRRNCTVEFVADCCPDQADWTVAAKGG